jgi:type IV secretory pathway VirB10-like protein
MGHPDDDEGGSRCIGHEDGGSEAGDERYEIVWPIVIVKIRLSRSCPAVR